MAEDPHPGFGSDSEEDEDPRLGKVLQGRYQVQQRIAAGGMGSVYKGVRLGLRRPVAIKFLHAAMAREPQVMKRFELEAQAMSRLAHPNCVAVLDYGVDDMPYLVMDFVQGAPLRRAIDAGALPPYRAIKIARQLLAALGHAHAQGIVHRDIKPENIVLDATPGLADHARILDFGLAKLLGTDLGLTVGMAIGTPNYMAPEQTREGPVDGRADLYAVGIVLFEMLTTIKPFDSDQVGEVLLKQLGMPAPRLRKARPEAATLSAELEAVVLRAMAKAPADRHASADEMIAALDAVPEASVTPPPGAEAALAARAGVEADATILQTPRPYGAGSPVPGSPARKATPALPLTPVPPSPSPSPSRSLLPSLSGRVRRWLEGHPLRLAGASALVSALVVLLAVGLWPARGGKDLSRTPVAPAPAATPAARLVGPEAPPPQAVPAAAGAARAKLPRRPRSEPSNGDSSNSSSSSNASTSRSIRPREGRPSGARTPATRPPTSSPKGPPAKRPFLKLL